MLTDNACTSIGSVHMKKKKEQPYYKASELLPQETIALLMKIEVLAWVPHPVDLLACVCTTFML